MKFKARRGRLSDSPRQVTTQRETREKQKSCSPFVARSRVQRARAMAMLPYHDSWLSRVKRTQLLLTLPGHAPGDARTSDREGAGRANYLPRPHAADDDKTTHSSLVSAPPGTDGRMVVDSHGTSTSTSTSRQEQDWIALLHEAAEEGKDEYCRLLIYRGIPVDGRDALWGMTTTALHKCILACRRADGWRGWATATSGHETNPQDTSKLRTAEALLRMGADVEARDNQAATPLLKAAHRGHLRMVRLLLVHGADPGAERRRGDVACEPDVEPEAEPEAEPDVRDRGLPEEPPLGHEALAADFHPELRSNPRTDDPRGPATVLLACISEEDTEGPKFELVQAVCEAGAPYSHVLRAIARAEAVVTVRETCLRQSIADEHQGEYVASDRSALEDAQNVRDYLRARWAKRCVQICKPLP
jgi:hypothetical protein